MAFEQVVMNLSNLVCRVAEKVLGSAKEALGCFFNASAIGGLRYEERRKAVMAAI